MHGVDQVLANQGSSNITLHETVRLYHVANFILAESAEPSLPKVAAAEPAPERWKSAVTACTFPILLDRKSEASTHKFQFQVCPCRTTVRYVTFANKGDSSCFAVPQSGLGRFANRSDTCPPRVAHLMKLGLNWAARKNDTLHSCPSCAELEDSSILSTLAGASALQSCALLGTLTCTYCRVIWSVV